MTSDVLTAATAEPAADTVFFFWNAHKHTDIVPVSDDDDDDR